MLPSDALPERRPGAGYRLLDGIRVLDLTTSVAGPYATMMLADMGAGVIKVERPGAGDDARHWGPPFLNGHALWFLSVNRNKQSIALDMTNEEGMAVFHDLVRACDVLVTNQVPRVQEKLGTDYASLKAVKPDLIFVSITGFGLEGERRNMACYDLIAEGYSSVMDLTGEFENDPQKVGTPAADMLAGMDAAYGAVCAIRDRERTGNGHLVDVALVDSMTRFMTPRLISYLGSGELARRSGGRDSVIAIYQVFHAADAPLTLGLGNDNIWKRFWAAVGEPDVGEDDRWNSNIKRRENRAEIVERLGAILKTRKRDDWLALFAENGVPAGPLNRLDEVSADPLLQERGLFYKTTDDSGTGLPQVNTGIEIDGQANDPRNMAPALGADGSDVMRNVLGYDAARIDALTGNGTVTKND
jgi:crotonobetainyl-CoA:carnitine CoA-transferase CaiB-like acyl-CoA transferase